MSNAQWIVAAVILSLGLASAMVLVHELAKLLYALWKRLVGEGGP